MNGEKLIERYTPRERINHWVVAVLFVLLALSGLALFHPAFFFLSNLFGGGPWMRILHPYIGVVLAISFAQLARRFWSQNRITHADKEWMRRVRDVLARRDEALPEAGRFNAGQKYLFWVMVCMIVLLLLSGLVIWQPWFAPLFSVDLVRIAVLVHALAAFVLIAGIIVHIYAAIWVKGSVAAMTRGTVSAAWARQHHAAWFREADKSTK